jgi:2Fe-2S ferredoxin
MPTVRFLKQNIEVTVPAETSILEAARLSGAPEGSACGGVCACSTCHVYVLAGGHLLSEPEEEEEDILDKAFDVRASSRLGCQAKVEREGVVEVEITRESLDAYYAEHPEHHGAHVPLKE